jgi:dipeptidyl aminopeptidase/acylaminoacyl peptidase
VVFGAKTMSKKRRLTIKEIAAFPFFGLKPYVSPDCSKVMYLKGFPNLKKNSFDVEGHIYNIETKETHLLFKNSRFVKWLDSSSICCLKHVQSSETSQIHIYQNLIGEPVQVTNFPKSITDYEPFENGFVFTSSSMISHSKQRIGTFNHVESEDPTDGLFYADPKRTLINQESVNRNFPEENVKQLQSYIELTTAIDEPLSINSFVVSPKTNVVYLNCQLRSEMHFEDDTQCYKIEFDPDTIIEKLDSSLDEALSSIKIVKLNLPKGYKVLQVSPDGKKVLLKGRDIELIPETRPDLWIIDGSDLETGRSLDKMTCITEKIDRYLQDVVWTEYGIYMSHWNDNTCCISKLDESGEFTTYSLDETYPLSFFTMNDNGHIAFLGQSPTMLNEIYYGIPDSNGWTLTRLTSFNEQYSHLDFGTVESIKWVSKDGTKIEGILRKPSDFNPKKKYPLIVFPHGGPRGCSSLSYFDNDYFNPVQSLLGKGILILQPNYRGSIGRGRAFMELNHNNMGVGDTWDIESGIDFLIAQGFVDETKVGSMGSSQGGYISAFAAMHTDRFAAVSVTAGVSSWHIYYIGSDNRRTIQLTGTPYDSDCWDNYVRSAPISAIDRAKTPMLVQHGANDERISVVSAKELYRALKHKGVPTELFIYPGKGHWFLAPQDNYAMMLHVHRWFCHYLLGEELDFFKNDFQLMDKHNS